MSEPEDRGETGRGRRHARPSGDTGGQGNQGGWPARYGPRPDFTLPPDHVSTLPGEEPPAGRPGRHSGGGTPAADSGWFGSPYEGTRRSARPAPATDPYPQPAPSSRAAVPQPGRRRRPEPDPWEPSASPASSTPPAPPAQPARYAGHRGRDQEPDDYGFDGRDGYSGRADPYGHQDGYADPYADPYAERDGYAGRDDPFTDQAGYDGYTQHVAGPGRPVSGEPVRAEQEPPWDGEDGYEDDDRFVPGLGGRRDEDYDDDDGPGRGGRGGRSGRGGGDRGKRRRRWVIPLVVILIVLLVPIGVGGFYAYRVVQGRFYPADYSTGGTGQAIVQVQSGQTATQVGQRLVTLGVVASVRAFELAAEHSTSQNGLEPGFYRLKKHMKATLAFQLLLSPSARIQDKITIPEGLRLTQIQAQLGAHSGIPLADYQKALKSPGSLGLPSYANGKPEGYLFPATYEVQPDQTATGVLQAMVQRFNQEAAADNLTQAAAARHLSPGQVITVASLIQAEGGSTTYYSRIAQVIYNRLARNMKLQLDSTVMYGLNTFGIIASNQQLQSNSPYNTYKYAGLPPGPIDSPGHAAIEAALHPAPGSDLYFVTTNPKTGLTQFTSSQTQFEQFRQELERNLGQ